VTEPLLLEIGHVGRAHGLRGDVVVDLLTTVEDRLATGSTLECRGTPLVVGRAQALPGKVGLRGSHWLVHFVGIDTREAAESLGGALLRAEPLAGINAGSAGGPDDLWVHHLIGSEVTSANGENHGTVTSVEANPASDLLVLDSGALVPLRFVVRSEPGRLVVDVPAGLFEL
jgi:16S rRNA processing protein RimM